MSRWNPLSWISALLFLSALSVADGGPRRRTFPLGRLAVAAVVLYVLAHFIRKYW